jgi:cytosine/uracil/thiamine/allantoin permease
MSATPPNQNAAAGAGSPPPPPLPQPPDEPRDPRFFWLTVAQYALIFAVTLIFVYVLAHGMSDVEKLANPDTARGLITFVIAVATVAIAMMKKGTRTNHTNSPDFSRAD